jgi:hypothetical protein
MKLATYKDGSRDGQLVVVSRDLSTAHYATGIAHTPAAGAGRLELHRAAAAGPVPHAEPGQGAPRVPLTRPCAWRRCRAPTSGPTARPTSTMWSWCGPRATRGAGQFYTDPLMYQGGSDDLLGPCDPVVVPSEDGHRLRGRDRGGHRRRAHGRRRRAGAGRHSPADAGQRCVAAQPDSGRAGQGLWFFPEQAGHRLQPGGRHARRAGRAPGAAGACT